jgi:arylsulfatase
MRWPGTIEAGSVLNGIVSHIDMFPTLLAAAGNPDVTEQLLKGTTVGDQSYKVHLDGYNQIPYLSGEVKESPRNAIMYFSDDGDVMAVRVGDYKFHLAIQRANTMRLWAEPFEKLRLPYIMNLRRDPLERAEYNSNTYMDWMVNHVPQLYMMQAIVAEQIAGFAAFPPRQKPASFNLDAVLGQVTAATGTAAKTKAAAK